MTLIDFIKEFSDEFCYKFNRRYFGENLFNRLIIKATYYKNNLSIVTGKHII